MSPPPQFPHPPDRPAALLRLDTVSVSAGSRRLLSDVSLDIPPNTVHGLIGPSGVGKSTLLRTLNRMVELTPGLRVSGQVWFHGRPIYDPHVNADDMRARIGLLLQQPVVFPKSIAANVVFGARHLGRLARRDHPQAVERALREAALWDEVKDRLSQPAHRLSVGQQQRLCLARTLATEPEVILMDEPTSALDPRSTEAIEELMVRLKTTRTLILVTHNLAQAHRVCDNIARLTAEDGSGRLVTT